MTTVQQRCHERYVMWLRGLNGELRERRAYWEDQAETRDCAVAVIDLINARIDENCERIRKLENQV